MPAYALFLEFHMLTLTFFSAYLHVKDGSIKHGDLVRRKCPAKMTVFYLDDPSDHRIILVPSGYHRHPPFRPVKLSIPARVEYEERARTFQENSGVGLTVGRLHHGMCGLM